MRPVAQHCMYVHMCVCIYLCVYNTYAKQFCFSKLCVYVHIQGHTPSMLQWTECSENESQVWKVREILGPYTYRGQSRN